MRFTLAEKGRTVASAESCDNAGRLDLAAPGRGSFFADGAYADLRTQAYDTIGHTSTTEREKTIEECKAVMRDEMNVYRAETLSASAARVAIQQCIGALDALKCNSPDLG